MQPDASQAVCTSSLSSLVVFDTGLQKLLYMSPSPPPPSPPPPPPSLSAAAT